MSKKLALVVATVIMLFTASLPAEDFGSTHYRGSYDGIETPTAFAYLNVPFGTSSRRESKMQYGLALASPTWGSVVPSFDLDTSKLVDLQFSGVTSASLSVANMTAWSSEKGWHANAANGEDPDRTVWIALGTIAAAVGTIYWICENERNKEGKKDGC